MQTRAYGDLFSLISNMIGAVTLASDEQTQVANFINRRFFEAYRTSPVWPRYVVTGEERDIAVINVSGVTSPTSLNGSYKLVGTVTGASVKNGSNLYMQDPSVASGTGSNAVSGLAILKNNSDQWEIRLVSEFNLSSDGVNYEVSGAGLGALQYQQLDTEDRDHPADVVFFTETAGSGQPRLKKVQVIPYTQNDKQAIGDFSRIHRKQPFYNNSAIEYDFYADVDGANILNITNTTDSTAFVTYKIPFEKLSPTLSDPVVSADYYDSDLAVPEEFFNYIAHTVYADFLRVQNKQEEAIAEENVGAKYLAQELEKVDLRMNNSTINKRFSTYVSRQSR